MKKSGWNTPGSVGAHTTGRTATVERRREPRLAITAAIMALEAGGTNIEARTTDLASGGCYVDAMNPFPPGTCLHIRLTKYGRSFDAQAKVVYSNPGVGMGLAFTLAEPEQLQIVTEWLAEARGESTPPQQEFDEIAHDSTGASLKSEEHFALEELLVALMRKGILTEDEGEPILRRLLR